MAIPFHVRLTHLLRHRAIRPLLLIHQRHRESLIGGSHLLLLCPRFSLALACFHLCFHVSWSLLMDQKVEVSVL